MRRLALAMALGAASLLLVDAASAKWADSGSGNDCQATINGQDLASADKIAVDAGSDVEYAFSAAGPIASYDLQLSYGPYEASPSSGVVESDETEISGTAKLSDYAWLGVGLYELKGEVVLDNGETCTGSIVIDVQGNPLTTAVGATAAAVSGASTIALVALFLKDAGILFTGA